VDYESLIPYLSESIKQNYGDIQHVTAEVDSVKRALDTLYERFTGQESSVQLPVANRSQSTRGKVVGWVVGILATVAVLVTLAAVLLFSSGSDPQNYNLSPQLEGLPAEREALLTLYHALRPRDSHPEWNLTAPSCLWNGITCNLRNQVIGIQLFGFSVIPGVGEKLELPDIFGNFSELMILGLNSNNINSTFPASFATLHKLEYISLTSNQFFGTVPDLRGLRKLKALFLSDNMLTGPLDTLVQIPALESLRMQNNPINAELPRNIPLSLTELQLSHTGLHGTIPESWTSSNLKFVDIRENNLTGSVPCLGPNLLEFDASFNDLDGEFCGHSLTSISSLKLADNKLKGTFELPVQALSKMAKLVLLNNQFTSFMPSSADQLIETPTFCLAANNDFKCPVPTWSVAKCRVTCK
jgi:Leucine-rich repeat (LRR) protein